MPLKSLEIRLFYHKLNTKQRGNSLSVFHRNSLKYSNDQRKTRLKLTQFLRREKYRIPRHYSATATKNEATSKQSIEFTYSDFPCHFKVSSDKPALTFRRWKSKTGKRLTITTNFFERTLGTALSGKKIRPVDRIVKSWTGYERVINQSDSRI